MTGGRTFSTQGFGNDRVTSISHHGSPTLGNNTGSPNRGMLYSGFYQSLFLRLDVSIIPEIFLVCWGFVLIFLTYEYSGTPVAWNARGPTAIESTYQAPKSISSPLSSFGLHVLTLLYIDDNVHFVVLILGTNVVAVIEDLVEGARNTLNTIGEKLGVTTSPSGPPPGFITDSKYSPLFILSI